MHKASTDGTPKPSHNQVYLSRRSVRKTEAAYMVDKQSERGKFSVENEMSQATE